MNKNFKYIVGIDEVGRGPLAGNLKLKKMFKGARDSKKMSIEKREEIFALIKQAQKDNLVRYIVRYESSKNIDKKGISWCIKNCIKKCLKNLEIPPEETLVLLDGGIKAPEEFIYQKTIIKGDDKEICISLASIAAKVTRDRRMKKLAKKYPLYGFENHKGYGTLYHRFVIQNIGPSEIHRKTYLKNLTFK